MPARRPVTMTPGIDAYRFRHDSLLPPRLWVAIALSILIHFAAVTGLPRSDTLKLLPPAGEDPQAKSALSLRLMPPLPPAPAAPGTPSVARPASRPAVQAQRPKPAPPPKPAPVIAVDKPAPAAPAAPPVTAAPRPAPEGDMAAYIEARRRARGATASTASAPATGDDEEARRQRIIAGNLGSTRERTFGYDPRQGGGMFQIERLDYDHAAFIFYGWNNNISRNTKQLIEVSRGNHSDIRIAVVRRMIAIIRENAQEDFLWVSQRLGRTVTLSARSRDNAGLEDFMMRDFFPAVTPAQQ
jgi:hypothetical protein